MTLSKSNEYMVSCDGDCSGTCDWATADSQREANELFKENGWTVKGKEHFCQECSQEASHG